MKAANLVTFVLVSTLFVVGFVQTSPIQLDKRVDFNIVDCDNKLVPCPVRGGRSQGGQHPPPPPKREEQLDKRVEVHLNDCNIPGRCTGQGKGGAHPPPLSKRKESVIIKGWIDCNENPELCHGVVKSQHQPPVLVKREGHLERFSGGNEYRLPLCNNPGCRPGSAAGIGKPELLESDRRTLQKRNLRAGGKYRIPNCTKKGHCVSPLEAEGKAELLEPDRRTVHKGEDYGDYRAGGKYRVPNCHKAGICASDLEAEELLELDRRAVQEKRMSGGSKDGPLKGVDWITPPGHGHKRDASHGDVKDTSDFKWPGYGGKRDKAQGDLVMRQVINVDIEARKETQADEATSDILQRREVACPSGCWKNGGRGCGPGCKPPGNQEEVLKRDVNSLEEAKNGAVSHGREGSTGTINWPPKREESEYLPSAPLCDPKTNLPKGCKLRRVCLTCLDDESDEDGSVERRDVAQDSKVSIEVVAREEGQFAAASHPLNRREHNQGPPQCDDFCYQTDNILACPSGCPQPKRHGRGLKRGMGEAYAEQEQSAVKRGSTEDEVQETAAAAVASDLFHRRERNDQNCINCGRRGGYCPPGCSYYGRRNEQDDDDAEKSMLADRGEDDIGSFDLPSHLNSRRTREEEAPIKPPYKCLGRGCHPPPQRRNYAQDHDCSVKGCEPGDRPARRLPKGDELESISGRSIGWAPDPPHRGSLETGKPGDNKPPPHFHSRDNADGNSEEITRRDVVLESDAVPGCTGDDTLCLGRREVQGEMIRREPIQIYDGDARFSELPSYKGKKCPFKDPSMCDGERRAVEDDDQSASDVLVRREPNQLQAGDVYLKECPYNTPGKCHAYGGIP